jgi:hypothetical protein
VKGSAYGPNPLIPFSVPSCTKLEFKESDRDGIIPGDSTDFVELRIFPLEFISDLFILFVVRGGSGNLPRGGSVKHVICKVNLGFPIIFISPNTGAIVDTTKGNFVIE